MSGLNGDYRSMAEAAGEAPPSGGGWTGDEFAELLHDVGDLDDALYLAGEVDRRLAGDRVRFEHDDEVPTS